MEVLNKQERQKAFIAFLIAFILTFSVMLIAVSFNFYMPKAENKLLKAENEMMKREYDYQTNFSVKIDSIRMTIDSINSRIAARTDESHRRKVRIEKDLRARPLVLLLTANR